MNVVKLVHNPGAGQQEHSEQILGQLLDGHQFAHYDASTKEEGWQKLAADVEAVLAAGGDGTVRKVAQMLLERPADNRPLPMAVLPLGTANNIATSLRLPESVDVRIAKLRQNRPIPYDVGQVRGLPKDEFFIESFGYGVLPRLIKAAKKLNLDAVDFSDQIQTIVLDALHDIILTYPAQPGWTEIDGVVRHGQYLLMEVINTRLIGPGLELAPDADSGDGELNLLLIEEHQRNQLANYVLNKISGRPEPFFDLPTKAKTIHLSWAGTDCHVDDKLINPTASTPVTVTVQPGRLTMLVP